MFAKTTTLYAALVVVILGHIVVDVQQCHGQVHTVNELGKFTVGSEILWDNYASKTVVELSARESSDQTVFSVWIYRKTSVGGKWGPGIGHSWDIDAKDYASFMEFLEEFRDATNSGKKVSAQCETTGMILFADSSQAKFPYYYTNFPNVYGENPVYLFALDSEELVRVIKSVEDKWLPKGKLETAVESVLGNEGDSSSGRGFPYGLMLSAAAGIAVCLVLYKLYRGKKQGARSSAITESSSTIEEDPTQPEDVPTRQVDRAESYLVPCPDCGLQLRVPSSVAQGEKVSCKCGHVFRLNSISQQQAPPSMPPAPLADHSSEQVNEMEPGTATTILAPGMVAIFAALFLVLGSVSLVWFSKSDGRAPQVVHKDKDHPPRKAENLGVSTGPGGGSLSETSLEGYTNTSVHSEEEQPVEKVGKSESEQPTLSNPSGEYIPELVEFSPQELFGPAADIAREPLLPMWKWSVNTACKNLSVSPDGRLLAVTGDKEVTIIRIADTRFLMEIPDASCLTFSHDGTRMAAIVDRNLVRVWSTETLADAEPVSPRDSRQLREPTLSVQPVAEHSVDKTSSDSLVSWSKDDRVVYLERSNGNEYIQLDLASGTAKTAKVRGMEGIWQTSNGPVVVSNLGGNRCRLAPLGDSEREFSLTTDEPNIRSRPGAISPDGRLLAVISGRSVTVFDLQIKRVIAEFATNASGGKIRHAVFSRSGRLVAAGSESSQVSVYDLVSKQTLAKLPVAPGGNHLFPPVLTGISFTPEEDHLIATVRTDGSGRVKLLPLVSPKNEVLEVAARNINNGSDSHLELQAAISAYCGLDGAKDIYDARELFDKAAETDSVAAIWVACHHQLGNCAYERDQRRAEELARKHLEEIRRLSDEEDEFAQFALARAGHVGLVKLPKSQIRNLYEQAARSGRVEACEALARSYAEASLGIRDFVLAAQWFQLAAINGHVEAMWEFGSMVAQRSGIVIKDKLKRVRQKDSILDFMPTAPKRGPQDEQDDRLIAEMTASRTAHKQSRKFANRLNPLLGAMSEHQTPDDAAPLQATFYPGALEQAYSEAKTRRDKRLKGYLRGLQNERQPSYNFDLMTDTIATYWKKQAENGKSTAALSWYGQWEMNTPRSWTDKEKVFRIGLDHFKRAADDGDLEATYNLAVAMMELSQARDVRVLRRFMGFCLGDKFVTRTDMHGKIRQMPALRSPTNTQRVLHRESVVASVLASIQRRLADREAIRLLHLVLENGQGETRKKSERRLEALPTVVPRGGNLEKRMREPAGKWQFIMQELVEKDSSFPGGKKGPWNLDEIEDYLRKTNSPFAIPLISDHRPVAPPRDTSAKPELRTWTLVKTVFGGKPVVRKMKARLVEQELLSIKLQLADETTVEVALRELHPDDEEYVNRKFWGLE